MKEGGCGPESVKSMLFGGIIAFFGLQLKINIVQSGLQWWQIRYAAESREQHTLINARPQQTPHKPAGLWREREMRQVHLVSVSVSVEKRERENERGKIKQE